MIRDVHEDLTVVKRSFKSGKEGKGENPVMFYWNWIGG